MGEKNLSTNKVSANKGKGLLYFNILPSWKKMRSRFTRKGNLSGLLTKKCSQKDFRVLSFFINKRSRKCKVIEPSEKAIPRKTPNKLIDSTSSHDEAAITSVGMPCSTP